MKDNANPQMASPFMTNSKLFRIGIVVKNRTLPEQSVRAIASPISNAIVTYVVSIDEDPEQWRETYCIPSTAIMARGIEAYTQMLQSNQIDAVYIVVPTLQQSDFVLPALQASLHVLLDDPISTYIDDFRTQLINAKKYQRFVQFPTMFQNQHRVQTFLDCVAHDIGKIESIDVLLSIHMDDVGVLGVKDPPEEGQCVIRRLARSCALLAALMFLRARKGVRPTAAQVLTVERHPVTEQATAATCRVWFTDDVTLDCRLAYSHTPTRQIMEVRSKDRYATLNDFVVPHPDGLATYRVYDRTPQSDGKCDFDMMRGEAIDVPGGPSSAVMMWRRFRTLCQSIQEHGWTDCPSTHLAREITSVSLQTKLILKALKESELSKEKVPIALDACDVHC